MDLIIVASLDTGRSGMAASFFNALVEPSVACAIAAIPEPVRLFDPEVAAAMRELKSGVALLYPSRLTAELGAEAALLINAGHFPHFLRVPAASQIDWDIADPSRQSPEMVRTIRNQIGRRVEGLLVDRGWLKRGGETMTDATLWSVSNH